MVDTKKLPATDIKTALKETGLEYIDWFLKLIVRALICEYFAVIPEKISNNILTAEFEPGIIDAMKGEDKITFSYGIYGTQNHFGSQIWKSLAPIVLVKKIFFH